MSRDRNVNLLDPIKSLFKRRRMKVEIIIITITIIITWTKETFDSILGGAGAAIFSFWCRCDIIIFFDIIGAGKLDGKRAIGCL